MASVDAFGGVVLPLEWSAIHVLLPKTLAMLAGHPNGEPAHELAAAPGPLLLANSRSWRLCGLTFELSGRRRQDARARAVKMHRVPQAGPWWPAVGAPLERGVRRHCAERAMATRSSGLRPMKRAELVAVRVTHVRKVQYARRARAWTRRFFD